MVVSRTEAATAGDGGTARHDGPLMDGGGGLLRIAEKRDRTGQPRKEKKTEQREGVRQPQWVSVTRLVAGKWCGGTGGGRQ